MGSTLCWYSCNTTNLHICSPLQNILMRTNTMSRGCKIYFAMALLMKFLVISLAIPKSNLTDQSALLAFKAHITSDPLSAITHNWSTTTSICQWSGVTCKTHHLTPRVVVLDLSHMQLGGTIPPHVGNLSFLVSINLSNNSFHGKIPSELARLRRLRFINLGSNNFTGGVPPSFASLSKLQELILASNGLTGTIPPNLFNITTLRVLKLQLNFLQGDIPEEIAEAYNLQILLLGLNNLSGAIPPVVFNNMPSLQIISIRDNKLSGILPEDLCTNHSKLERLILGGNEFYGRIPVHLFQCTGLQELELCLNSLTGSIPRGIGNLTKLNGLYLGGNNLEGEFPQEIGHLVSLRMLGLEFNNLHGYITTKIGNLTSLRIIGLEVNNFTGDIPREIGNYTLLENLNMENNHFTGTIPNEIGHLKNLQVLNLDQNRLSGLIPSTIFNISTLRVIGLNLNNFSGQLPSQIGLWLPNLQKLLISGNQLSGPIPTSICNASVLADVELSNSSFTGYIPDCLGNLRNLRRLSIFENHLTIRHSFPGWSFLESLANCRKLEILYLALNPLNSSIPNSIGNLSSSLQLFDASNCTIHGRIPRELGNLSSLIDLNLEGNQLIETIPTTIVRLIDLQELILRGNKLQGSMPSELCQMKSLGYLYLERNRLSGSIPSCLSNLTALRKLNVASNRFTGTIPSTIWTLQDILSINLSSNSLSGSLPAETGNLKVLIEVDLSKNQLSGEIPTSIGDLKDLAILYLHQNRFQGEIPQSFGSLISLEFLNVSHNSMSGQIPKSLQKLLYLKYLDVSFNQLRGEIPDGGPFANLSASSFRGNKALCGPARFQVPPCKERNDRSSTKHGISLALKCILPTIASTTLAIAIICIYLKCGESNSTPQGDLVALATWRRFSYHELHFATDGFQESNLLGTGSIGSVYKGTLSNGMTVAIKVFNLQLEGAFRSFEAECEVLRNLRHRNLVKIISSCCNLDFKALVLEFMPNGSLDKWLYSCNYFLDLPQRLSIMIDVASAVEYLHKGYTTQVVHCDIKPSNVLLNEEMVGHLSDFGITKLLGNGESMTQTWTLATVGYMAPEYGLEGIVSARGDVYSYGILVMETFTRKKPTDEMFDGGMCLRDWVKVSLPHSVTTVVDANLLTENDEHFIAKRTCMTSILELALQCSSDLPEERMDMGDVVAALKKIELQYIRDEQRP